MRRVRTSRMDTFARRLAALTTPSSTWLRQPCSASRLYGGKHSGIESAFSEYLVKPGHVEVEFARIYQKARRHREEADYAEDVIIEEATAHRVLADAERFTDRLERFLEDAGALQKQPHGLSEPL